MSKCVSKTNDNSLKSLAHTERSMYLNALDTVFVQYLWCRHIGRERSGCVSHVGLMHVTGIRNVWRGSEVNEGLLPGNVEHAHTFTRFVPAGAGILCGGGWKNCL